MLYSSDVTFITTFGYNFPKQCGFSVTVILLTGHIPSVVFPQDQKWSNCCFCRLLEKRSSKQLNTRFPWLAINSPIAKLIRCQDVQRTKTYFSLVSYNRTVVKIPVVLAYAKDCVGPGCHNVWIHWWQCCRPTICLCTFFCKLVFVFVEVYFEVLVINWNIDPLLLVGPIFNQCITKLHMHPLCELHETNSVHLLCLWE